MLTLKLTREVCGTIVAPLALLILARSGSSNVMTYIVCQGRYRDDSQSFRRQVQLSKKRKKLQQEAMGKSNTKRR